VIAVVADTSCDLPGGVATDLGIDLVSLTVRFGDGSFADRSDISTAEFWSRLASAATLPTTAAPSAGRFVEALRRLHGSGATGAVVITLSGALSGTYDAAVTAAGLVPEIPTQVIDSRLASMATGLVAMTAAGVAHQGSTLTAVADAAHNAVGRTRVLAALAGVEHLRRGGRIGAGRAYVGSVLGIQPLISIQRGTVVPAGRARTRRKARAEIVATVAGFGEQLEALAIIHGQAPDLPEFEEELRQVCSLDDLIVAEVGPIIGTHAGPGLIGVCYRLR